MSKHTSGPWHTGGDIRVTNDNRIRRNVWGPTPPGMQSGEMVCQLATVDNARLIACAPELLEKLDQLTLVVGLTAFKHEDQRAVLQQALDEARAAIAKAGAV